MKPHIKIALGFIDSPRVLYKIMNFSWSWFHMIDMASAILDPPSWIHYELHCQPKIPYKRADDYMLISQTVQINS